MFAQKALPNEKFRIESKKKDGRIYVSLHGTIDEDTNLQSIVKLGGPIVFNFKDLVAINSCGIRSWVNLLKELGSTPIAYEHCPPLIVRQLNMVPSFRGTAKVLSLYLPYMCDSCEAEKLVFLESSKYTGVENIAEVIPCDQCRKGEMEFDGHPNQYFAFIG